MKKCPERDSELSSREPLCPMCAGSDKSGSSGSSECRDSHLRGKSGTACFSALALSIFCAALYHMIQYALSLLLSRGYYLMLSYLGLYSDDVADRYFNSNTSHVILILSCLATAAVIRLIFMRRRADTAYRGENRARLTARRVVAFALLGAALQYVLSFLTSCIPWSESTILTHYEIMRSSADGNLVLAVLSVVVVTAVVEETVFRRTVVSLLSRAFSPLSSILISAVIFGAAHLSPVALFYATLLGVILAGLYVKYRSTLPGIVVHMFFNLAAIVLPSTGKTSLDIALLIASWLLALLMLYRAFGRTDGEKSDHKVDHTKGNENI